MIVSINDIAGTVYHNHLTKVFTHTPLDLVDQEVAFIPLEVMGLLNELPIRVVVIDTTLSRPDILLCNVTHDDKEPALVVQVGGDFDISTWLNTIEHELKHVKQFCDGKLRITPNGVTWNGVLYPETRFLPEMQTSLYMIDELDGFIDTLRYFSQPWECEANSHCWEETFSYKADTIREVIKLNNVLWCEDWDRETFKDVLCDKGLRSAYRAMGVKLGGKTCL